MEALRQPRLTIAIASCRIFTGFTAVFCSTGCERLARPLSWSMMTCRPQCLFRVLASDTLFLLLGETKTVRRQMFSRSTGAGHRLGRAHHSGDHATRSSRHVVHLFGHRNVLLDARGGNAGGPTLLENPPVSGPAPLMQGGISATESLPFSRCRHLSEDKARSPKLALAKNLPFLEICTLPKPCSSPKTCRMSL